MAIRRLSSALSPDTFLAPYSPHNNALKGLSSEQIFTAGFSAWQERGQYGTIARLARDYQLPRVSIEACREEFERTHPQLCRASLILAPVQAVGINRDHIQLALVLSRASFPISFRSLQLAVSFFLGVSISYGTTYNMVAQVQDLADAFLAQVRLDKVRRIAIDEMFLHDRAMLVVIDLETEYVCGIKVIEHLNADAWVEFLKDLRDKQGLRPHDIVSDAGTSLCPAAAEVFPQAIAHRDIFHAIRDLGELLESFAKRAYKSLKSYYKARAKRGKALPGDRQGPAQTLRHAEDEAERQVNAHDRVLTQVERAMEALQLVHLGDLPFHRNDGGSLPVRDTTASSRDFLSWEIRFQHGKDATHSLREVSRVLLLIPDPLAHKVGTYLKNQLEPLVSYHDQLARTLQNLAHNLDEQAAVLTFAAVYRIDRDRRNPLYSWKATALTMLRQTLLDNLNSLSFAPGRLAQLALDTCRAIQTCGRASSLVECFNSVSRSFVNISKRLSEPTMHLMAARWNLAQRKSGRLVGTCPYTELSGQRVEDWVAHLSHRQSPIPGPAGRRLALVPPLPVENALCGTEPLEDYRDFYTELAEPLFALG